MPGVRCHRRHEDGVLGWNAIEGVVGVTDATDHPTLVVEDQEGMLVIAESLDHHLAVSRRSTP